MNEVQIFKNDQFGEVRTLEFNNEPWFIAGDVCKSLDISDVGRATSRLDEDELTRIKIVSGGQLREVIAVNEPGLYGLVLGSRKKEALAFKRWVKHDVLPAIRKTGFYNLPKDYPSALRALADSEERRIALEAENQIMKPKALFADSVASANTTISVGEMAKILKQNGIKTGQNRLFEWLRKNGYLIGGYRSDYNTPTQRSMELGLFEVKETNIMHGDGSVTVSVTPKVTTKGQQYFVKLFLGENKK